MVHLTLPRLFPGRFAIHGLALAMINLPTKFEVFIFTYYKDMKGDEKCRNQGSLEVVRVTQGHWN